MKEFIKLIKKATDAIEDAAEYAAGSLNVEDYLTEVYTIDDDSDMKQYVLKYIEDYFYNS